MSSEIHLQRFLPYRLAVLAEQVSRTVAQLYTDRFQLSRAEWRVLAALAEIEEMTANDLAAFSTLDKMAVSRAVAALEARGCLVRHDHPHDRRNKLLRLTEAGKLLCEAIVPHALEGEAFLLSALSEQEQETLNRVIDLLMHKAQDLAGKP